VRIIIAAILICLIDLICNYAIAAEDVELKLQNGQGLKLEILKNTSHARDLSAPQFPKDLEISDDFEVRKTWFPWDPRGTNNYPLSMECRQESLRSRIWDHTAVGAQALALNDWADHCKDQIARGFLRRSYFPLLRFTSMNYDFASNPNIHLVRATLPDGRKLEGFIALKPDDTPRPFVIAKCGIYCNARESALHRLFMMHLYDESPFHVLSLANISSTDFQKDNQAVSVGGFDEGRQIYHIAQLLNAADSPVAKKISSVHVVGASLGGSAALYAGLYASLNDPPDHQSIQSVTAVCPVVVLENSIKSLFTRRFLSALINLEVLREIREVLSYVPILGNYFSGNLRRMRGQEVYHNLTSAIFNYYQDWTTETPWDLKPFEGLTVHTLDQFWDVNDFRNYYQQTTVPTITIASGNDEIVKTAGNSRLLARVTEKAPNKYVSSVFLPLGNHCAFGLSNGWANYSTILREYILSHTPEADIHWLKTVRKIQSANWGFRNHETIVDTSFEALRNSDQMELKLKIFSPYGGIKPLLCKNKNIYKAPSSCYRLMAYKVDLNSLPLDSFEIPQTKYDVTSLTRFANTRLSVLDENGELVVGTHHTPRFVRGWLWK
jgi:pimeloyl-ACP methyl ester carboxylesterase